MAMLFRTARHIVLTGMVLLMVLIGLIPSLIMVRIAGPDRVMTSSMDIMQKVIIIDDFFKKAKWYFDEFVQDRSKDVGRVIESVDRSMALAKELEGQIGPEQRDEVRGFLTAAKRFRIAVISYDEEVQYDTAGAAAAEMERIAFDMSIQTHQILQVLLRDVHENIWKSRNDLTAVLAGSQRLALAGLCVGILLGLASAFLMARLLIIPIRRLVAAAEGLSKGEWDYRVTMSTRDDFSPLADAFNRMAEQLSAKEQRLVSINRTLTENEQKLKVSEQELKNKVTALESFHNMTIDREDKMIELKKEINELLVQSGRKPRYVIPSSTV